MNLCGRTIVLTLEMRKLRNKENFYGISQGHPDISTRAGLVAPAGLSAPRYAVPQNEEAQI